MDVVGAQTELMRPTHKAQVIDQLKRLGRLAGRRLSDRESSAYRDAQEARQRDCDVLDTECSGVDRGDVVVLDQRLIECEPERVDGIAPEQVRIAEHR